MASEIPNANANGGPSKSLAAMLEEQHARDTAHKATVEDAVDEEDVKHPPPSSLLKDQSPVALETPSPAEPAAPSPPAQAVPKKTPAFDVQSEESFPALGSGPKPKAPAAATWGAKPSAAAAVANGAPSGVPACMFNSYYLLALRTNEYQLPVLDPLMFLGSCLFPESTWNSFGSPHLKCFRVDS